MKGRPFLSWLAFLICWSILVIPLFRVTLRASDETRVDERTDEETLTWIKVRFSGAPKSFSLSQDGSAFWEVQDSAETKFEESFPLRIEDGVLELDLNAEVTGSRFAIEVTASPDTLPERSVVVWVDGNEVNEPIEFYWGDTYEH